MHRGYMISVLGNGVTSTLGEGGRDIMIGEGDIISAFEVIHNTSGVLHCTDNTPQCTEHSLCTHDIRHTNHDIPQCTEQPPSH